MVEEEGPEGAFRGLGLSRVERTDEDGPRDWEEVDTFHSGGVDVVRPPPAPPPPRDPRRRRRGGPTPLLEKGSVDVLDGEAGAEFGLPSGVVEVIIAGDGAGEGDVYDSSSIEGFCFALIFFFVCLFCFCVCVCVVVVVVAPVGWLVG